MKLPPIFQKKIVSSYFLVLILRQEIAHAVIFEEKEGTVKIIGENEENFKTSIEEADIEELLGVVDKIISKAEETLPANIETQNTIFGLKESWIEKEGIRKEYLPRLKKISEELGLKPLGFLVIHEAIAHLLQKEEGAPVSSVLAEIGKNYATVSLIRAGRVIESKTGEVVEGSFPQSVDTLLKHFQTSEILPSRVIIFDGEKDLSQEFITHSWSKSLPFLHLPQITNLPTNFDARAVLFGAAKEMGFEVLPGDLEAPATKNDEEEIIPAVIEAPEEKEEKRQEQKEPEKEKEENLENLPADYFGFSENLDVSKKTPLKIAEVKEEEIGGKIEEIPEDLKINNAEKKSFPVLAISLATGSISIVKKGLSSIKLPGISTLPILGIAGNKKFLFLPILGIFILAVLLFLYLFASRATITLTVSPKNVEKTQDVLFSTKSPTDLGKGTIASEIVSVTQDGNATGNVTGKKDVGDKAKGTVTIFNNSDSSRTLPTGTTITSSNDLDFSLDKAVTVASASGDIFSGTKPGTANVSITAAKIGTEYNLPSNTKFTIAASSSIAGKNDNPFSGGTKKQVTVVSKDDLKKLEDKLTKDLEEKARGDLKGKISAGKFLLPDFINENFSKETFSKKEGDEASQLTLSGTVEYQAIVYDKKDLVAFAKSLFNVDEKGDLKLDEGSINLNIQSVKTKTKTEAQTNANIKAKLTLQIDPEKLAKTLAGKEVSEAEQILNSFPQVSRVKISVFPKLPFIRASIPRRYKSISIKVSLNE